TLLRAGIGGRIRNFFQRRLRLVLASGEDERTDRAVDHAFPETTPQRKLGNALMHRFAETADEAGEIADPCRQNRLDALAHAARNDRRCAAGADSDDDIAAIDNGRKDEGRVAE